METNVNVEQSVQEAAKAAGYKPDVYAQWSAEAKQQGLSTEDYIALLDEDIRVAGELEEGDEDEDEDEGNDE